MTENQQIAKVGIVAVLGGLIGAGTGSNPLVGFLIGGLIFGGIGWLLLTDAGEEIFVRATDFINHESATTPDDDNTERNKTREMIICSNCGWQNPNHNKYCHDCGEALVPE